jgi:hypothetical protein
MSHVFIAHVEEDADAALQIALSLEEAGYRTWCYEVDSIPGTSHIVRTGEAVEQSQAVVVVISPNSLGSAQVTKEVVRAHESAKHFIPILRDITHAEFQKRQPDWREAIGSAASMCIPTEGVTLILQPVLEGIRSLGVQPSNKPDATRIGRIRKELDEIQGHLVVQHSMAVERIERLRQARYRLSQLCKIKLGFHGGTGYDPPQARLVAEKLIDPVNLDVLEEVEERLADLEKAAFDKFSQTYDQVSQIIVRYGDEADKSWLIILNEEIKVALRNKEYRIVRYKTRVIESRASRIVSTQPDYWLEMLEYIKAFLVTSQSFAEQDAVHRLIKEADLAVSSNNLLALQVALGRLYHLCEKAMTENARQVEQTREQLVMTVGEFLFPEEENIVEQDDTENSRTSKSRTTADHEIPIDRVDLVHFTITAPPIVEPGNAFIIDIWAHLETQREEVMKRAQDEIRSSELTIKSKGPIMVAQGSTLSVRLKLEDLIIEDPEDTILWKGEIGKATFAIRTASDARLGSRSGLAEIYINGLRITRIYFIIQIGRKSAEIDQIPTQEQRYRTAFASYAKEDRYCVSLCIQGLIKGLPNMDIFWDVDSLRSGQKWEQELQRVIPLRDEFYLFWSANALKSKWVEMEWRYALSKRGLDYIDPFPLVSPDEVPPPKELASLHFYDRWVAYRRRKMHNGFGF